MGRMQLLVILNQEKRTPAKLAVPEGIIWDKKMTYSTPPKVNIILKLIAGLKGITGHRKRGQTDDVHRLSPYAVREGLLHDPLKGGASAFLKPIRYAHFLFCCPTCAKA